jgi:hypothetical protein
MKRRRVLKILGIAVFVVLVLAVAGLVALRNIGPKKSEFLHLQTPRIVTKADTPALMADFHGDPEEVIRGAFGKVFSIYYGLDRVPKLSAQPAPVARYEGLEDLLKNFGQEEFKNHPWKGFVAVPVPQNVSALPKEATEEPFPVRLDTLTYGTVAEIVHFGPYEKEQPAIAKLLEHIKEQGYEISGLHEEEYIKGPGLLPTDPDDYITIIRYQVRKPNQD